MAIDPMRPTRSAMVLRVMPLPCSSRTRRPTNQESFWREAKKPVYDLILLSEDEVVQENVLRVSQAFDGERGDARAKEPKSNMRKQEIKNNSKMFSFRARNKLMTLEQRKYFD